MSIVDEPPHGITAYVNLSLACVGDINLGVLDDWYVKPKFLYHGLDEVLFACVQERIGGDRLHLLFEGLGVCVDYREDVTFAE